MTRTEMKLTTATMVRMMITAFAMVLMPLRCVDGVRVKHPVRHVAHSG